MKHLKNKHSQEENKEKKPEEQGEQMDVGDPREEDENKDEDLSE
jgi:hypothetical protein